MKKISLKDVKEGLKRDEMRMVVGGGCAGCGGDGCRFHSDCSGAGCYCYSINGGSSCRTSSPY